LGRLLQIIEKILVQRLTSWLCLKRQKVFARYKFLKVVFAHAEFNLTQSQKPSIQLSPTGGLQKISINSQNAYAGLGYNSGMGDFGSEIYVLYNFLADDNIVAQKFEIRFGLTYKF
jgi:hypothetical protein